MITKKQFVAQYTKEYDVKIRKRKLLQWGALHIIPLPKSVWISDNFYKEADITSFEWSLLHEIHHTLYTRKLGLLTFLNIFFKNRQKIERNASIWATKQMLKRHKTLTKLDIENALGKDFLTFAYKYHR